MRFEISAPDEAPAGDLIAAMVEETSELYGGAIDGPAMPSATRSDFSAPGGACLVGYEGDRPVCVGAVKRLDARSAEIKRMYVVEDQRGHGVAVALLAALEQAAQELGYRRARLDTGRLQPSARRIFERAGYRSIDDYNANPLASWWGERDL